MVALSLSQIYFHTDVGTGAIIFLMDFCPCLVRWLSLRYQLSTRAFSFHSSRVEDLRCSAEARASGKLKLPQS